MRILVENKSLAYASPLAKLEGFQLFAFNEGIHPAFDAFDKSDPDIFICFASSLSSSVIKNIKERPQTKTVVINDSEKHQELRKEIGNYFYQIKNQNYCQVDLCSLAEQMTILKSETFCPFGEMFPVEKMSFRSAKIFSSAKAINHKFFCGSLPPEFRFNGYASCKYSLVPESEWYNAIVCGSIPILDDSLTPAVELSKDEILQKHTNYNFCEDLLELMGMTQEKNILSAIEKWTGGNI